MKHMYPYKKVENLIYKNNPLLAMMPKETKFPGRNATYAIQYGVTGGRSADFAKAQIHRSGTPLQHFVVTRVKDYAVVSVDNETLLAADGSEGSLLDVAKVKTDAALSALARAMGGDVYRNGSGVLGTISGFTAKNTSTTPDTDAFCVVSSADIVNFEVGQVLQVYDTSGSALVTAAHTVSKVDRDANKVSFDADPATAPAAGDTLINVGDHNVKLSGLDSWLPATAPTVGDDHFNVDRSVDPTRLAGLREGPASSGGIKQTLFNAGVRLNREGGRPDAIFMNPLDWGTLASALEGSATFDSADDTGRRRYGGDSKSSTFGFSSLQMAGPSGVIKVYADHNCPSDVAYMLQMDTWALRTLGAAPRILDFDGLKGLREATTDGVEYRWGYYGNVLCKAPGYNCRVALA
jgi:hypothetical protein